jgi:hypothetical protein
MAVFCFLVFAVVFCYLMNTWSRELKEIEMAEAAAQLPDNVVVANFSEGVERKRAA